MDTLNSILKPSTNKPFICKFCGHGYTKEKTLISHVCEQKRRHLAREEKHVIIAYNAYVRFYNLMHKNTVVKSYEEFARSQYYNAFVKFGSFVHNYNPIYPDRYIDWIINSGAKLDHWCKEELYEQYTLELIQSEPVESALERSIKHMDKWANEHSSVWNHYFRYVSVSRAVYDVKDGKISPWLILNSPSGKALLSSMDDQQLSSVSKIIDATHWARTFKRRQADVELVKSIVAEAGL